MWTCDNRSRVLSTSVAVQITYCHPLILRGYMVHINNSERGHRSNMKQQNMSNKCRTQTLTEKLTVIWVYTMIGLSIGEHRRCNPEDIWVQELNMYIDRFCSEVNTYLFKTENEFNLLQSIQSPVSRYLNEKIKTLLTPEMT